MRARKTVLMAVFFIICASVIVLLMQFTDVTLTTVTLEFDTQELVHADGTVEDISDLGPGADMPELGPGEYFLFETDLKDYSSTNYLEIWLYDLNVKIYTNGELYFDSTVKGLQDPNFYSQTQVRVPMAEGRESVRLSFRVVPEGSPMMGPLTVFLCDAENVLAVQSSADYSIAVPAGVYAVLFLTVLGLLILSIYLRRLDLSVVMLTVASAIMLLRQLSLMMPQLFLPDGMAKVLSWNELNLVVLLLLVLYVIINWRRMWRSLAQITFWTFIALLAAYVGSKIQDTVFARRVDSVFSGLAGLSGIISWINIYLVVVCGSISAYRLVTAVLKTITESSTLALKNEYIMDNYRAIEQNYNETSQMRHEWRNQLTALELIYRQGDMERLGEKLQEMGREVDKLKLPKYSDCFIVNALLQNASVRAARESVSFKAQAPLPEKLDIDEGDLCSVVANLLDNALDAAVEVKDPSKRFVDISFRINQGFLAVCCRNSYVGELVPGEDGFPETSKGQTDGHGLGLKQIDRVVRKYGNKLDISWDGGVFTAQTAMRLPKKKD